MHIYVNISQITILAANSHAKTKEYAFHTKTEVIPVTAPTQDIMAKIAPPVSKYLANVQEMKNESLVDINHKLFWSLFIFNF